MRALKNYMYVYMYVPVPFTVNVMLKRLHGTG